MASMTYSSSKFVAIEFRQNKALWLSLAAGCFVLGLVLSVALHVKDQLRGLVQIRAWNADMVVIPKGMTLRGLEKEMLSGETSALLPLALFETTQGLAQGQFELQAILPEKQGAQVKILSWGNTGIGTAWLPGEMMAPGADSARLSTPEWGAKVIAAFFAKANPNSSARSLVALKELIDRKSVAQAFFISEQLAEEGLLKDKIDHALALSVGAFALVFSCLALVSLLWLRQSFAQIGQVLTELGHTRGYVHRLQLLLMLLTMCLPALVGFLLAPNLNIY